MWVLRDVYSQPNRMHIIYLYLLLMWICRRSWHFHHSADWCRMTAHQPLPPYGSVLLCENFMGYILNEWFTPTDDSPESIAYKGIGVVLLVHQKHFPCIFLPRLAVVVIGRKYISSNRHVFDPGEILICSYISTSAVASCPLEKCGLCIPTFLISKNNLNCFLLLKRLFKNII